MPEAAKSRYFRPSKVTGRYGRFDDILLGVANGSLFSSLQHSADGLFPKVAGAFFWNSRDLHGGPVAGRPAGGPDVAVGCRPTATRTLGCDRFETAANYAFSLA